MNQDVLDCETHDYIVVNYSEVGQLATEGWTVIGEVTRVLMEKPK